MRNRDFRDELERRERESSGKSGKAAIPAVVRRAIEANSGSSSKRQKTDSAANLDADDPVDNDSSSDSDDDDDSDDDTAALLAELNKIKRERVVETEQREAARHKEEERIRMENILSGNPLINYSPRGDLKIKRRWDDDVVFKNCARSEPDKKTPQFINDSLRSDFHKKFMEKYIK